MKLVMRVKITYEIKHEYYVFVNWKLLVSNAVSNIQYSVDFKSACQCLRPICGIEIIPTGFDSYFVCLLRHKEHFNILFMFFSLSQS